MSDFDSELSAQQPPEAPFSDEWALEIERRIAELDAGTAKTTSWSTIRDEALARLKHI